MQAHRPHPVVSESLGVGSNSLTSDKIWMNLLPTVSIPDSENYCFRPYGLWSSTLAYYIPGLFLDFLSDHFFTRGSWLDLSVFREGFGTKCARCSSWPVTHAKQMLSSSNSWICKPCFTLICLRGKKHFFAGWLVQVSLPSLPYFLITYFYQHRMNCRTFHQCIS